MAAGSFFLRAGRLIAPAHGASENTDVPAGRGESRRCWYVVWPHRIVGLASVSRCAGRRCQYVAWRCWRRLQSLAAQAGVVGMLLPCHCHAYCHVIAIPLPCLLPCHCHVIAMLLPCHCHVVAMLLPCYCHDIAMIFAMPLPWHCHAIAMVLPCCRHAVPMLSPC